MFHPEIRSPARDASTAPRYETSAAEALPRAAPNLVALLERTRAARGEACAARVNVGGRWRGVSWNEVAQRARDVSDGLAALGVCPGDRVALLSETRLDAVVADLGVLGAGAITVPIYTAELGPQVADLLVRSGAVLVFCDGDAQARKLREIRGRVPALRGVVRFDGSPQDAFERRLADLELEGEVWRRAHPGAHAERVGRLAPEDVACIVFTSGTTGAPKGVVLTHDAWLYCAAAYTSLDVMAEDEVGLMFLPLAHVMGKMVVSTWLQSGATLAFARSIETVLEDAAATHPTVLAAPPRLFEKAFTGIVAKGRAAPGAKGRLFRMAMAAFEEHVAALDAGRAGGGGLRLAVARRLVFSKIAAAVRARFGGRMRLLLSGSAPLSTRVSRFFELLAMPIHQGYGLSETTGVGCTTLAARALHAGTVGPPLPGTELRLADDGEILLRSRGVMRGYWNDPEATAEVLEDGWLRTGDLGERDADGCVRITDRKKDLIKTSGGKFVAPQSLEARLRADPLVAGAMAVGDGRSYVTALVTLDEENVRRWAESAGVALGEPLARDPRVLARLQETVDAVNAELPRYATVKRFAILPEDFSIAGGELTPTLKLRRKRCAEKHRAVLDALYAEAKGATLH